MVASGAFFDLLGLTAVVVTMMAMSLGAALKLPPHAAAEIHDLLCSGLLSNGVHGMRLFGPSGDLSNTNNSLPN